MSSVIVAKLLGQDPSVTDATSKLIELKDRLKATREKISSDRAAYSELYDQATALSDYIRKHESVIHILDKEASRVVPGDSVSVAAPAPEPAPVAAPAPVAEPEKVPAAGRPVSPATAAAVAAIDGTHSRVGVADISVVSRRDHSKFEL